MIHRPYAPLLVAVLAAAGLVGIPAAHASGDPAFPTGTFHFAGTSTYLHEDRYGYRDSYAIFSLTADSVSDDATAVPDIVVKVIDGSGRPPMLWPNTAAQIGLTYDRVGTYSPQVWLTDAEHHTTVLDLPQVTVLEDFTAPRVSINLPPRSQRNRLSAWRTVHGSATDDGIGVTYVDYQVMQRRGARWYFFNEPRFLDKDYPRRWIKGAKSLSATRKLDLNRNSAPVDDASGTWRSEQISKLTRGPIVVCYSAEDSDENPTLTRCYSGRITRR